MVTAKSEECIDKLLEVSILYKMSKVVLFSNIKGGVGKTTLCAHFSEYLNEKGMSVSAAEGKEEHLPD